MLMAITTTTMKAARGTSLFCMVPRRVLAHTTPLLATATTTRPLSTAAPSVPDANDDTSPSIPVPPPDAYSSARLQTAHRNYDTSKAATEAYWARQSPRKASPAPTAKVLIHELVCAVDSVDPHKAWALYSRLTSQRAPDFWTADNDDEPGMPVRTDDDPKTKSTILPTRRVAVRLPAEVHSRVLHLVKNLSNRAFSIRHGKRIPLYVLVARVEHIVQVMRVAAVPMSDADMRALIDLYAREGRIQTMEFWTRQILRQSKKDDGAAPAMDIRVANSVLSGYVRAHRLTDAVKWLQLVTSPTYNLRPNDFTHSQLAILLSRSGDVDALEDLFRTAGGTLPADDPFRALDLTVPIAPEQPEQLESSLIKDEDPAVEAAAADGAHGPAPELHLAEPIPEAAPEATPAELRQLQSSFKRAIDLLGTAVRPTVEDQHSPPYHVYEQLILACGRTGDPGKAVRYTHAYLLHHPARATPPPPPTDATSQSQEHQPPQLPQRSGSAATRHVLDALAYALTRSHLLGPAQYLYGQYGALGVSGSQTQKSRVKSHLLRGYFATEQYRKANALARAMVDAAAAKPTSRSSPPTSSATDSTEDQDDNTSAPDKHKGSNSKRGLNFIAMSWALRAAANTSPKHYAELQKVARSSGLAQRRIWRRWRM
ncbi:hypothetical protein BC828DRAFT_436763 [Blastocladiella britannica]|nr:hypothetical protein BC828DRAFT_436763 [Blastocladiella britannica]